MDNYTPAEAVTEALKTLRDHGLWNWTVTLDNAKSRAGVCRYGKRQIGLSRFHIAANTRHDVHQTILHEVAHALTPGAHHGLEWRRVARELGYEGRRVLDGAASERMATATAVQAPWVGRCPAGHETPRFRRPTVKTPTQSCGVCAPRRFSRDHLITWFDAAGREWVRPAEKPLFRVTPVSSVSDAQWDRVFAEMDRVGLGAEPI